MVFVVGGSFQGKREFASRAFGLREEDWQDGGACEFAQAFGAPGLARFHELAARLAGAGLDPAAFVEQGLRRNPGVVVVSDETGCGVVPVRAEDRALRETVGRLHCLLAARAEKVYRVCCGVPQLIKGGGAPAGRAAQGLKSLATPRDVLLTEDAGSGAVWVTAVDSCGGIGTEPGDALRADPALAGKLTARVALLEVLAVGASPAFAAVGVSSGPHTAQAILGGVREALAEAAGAGAAAGFPLAVSTEKNMPTSNTGFSVTVSGRCEGAALRVARARPGDRLYCAGVPLVGPEVLAAGGRLFNPAVLAALLGDGRVRGVIPVGSRGVAAEAEVLARESGLICRFAADAGLDLRRSAGPSTCAVFAAPRGAAFEPGLPVREIGALVPNICG